MESPPEFDPSKDLGFHDLDGFKDYIGYVALCSPNSFPKSFGPHGQEPLNLEKAFVGLSYGLDLCVKEIPSPGVSGKCKELFGLALDDYKNDRVLEGKKKLNEVETLLRRYPTPSLGFNSILKFLLPGLLVLMLWWSYSYLIRDKWIDLRIPGNGNQVTAIAFSPDGSKIAFASLRAQRIYVWDVRTRSQKYILESPNLVQNLEYTSSGDLVTWGAELGEGDYARIWNAEGRIQKNYRNYQEFQSDLPDRAPRTRDQSEYRLDQAKTGDGCQLVVYDKKSGAAVDSIKCDGLVMKHAIQGIDASIFGIILEPVDSVGWKKSNGKTIIVNLISGKLTSLPSVGYYPGLSLLLSPDNHVGAIFESDWHSRTGVSVWDLNNQALIGKIPYYSFGFGASVRFSPDGRLIAVAGGDYSSHFFIPLPEFLDGRWGVVKLMDAKTLQCCNEYRTDRIATVVEFSPDGRRLAVGFEDGTVEILDESFTRRLQPDS